MHTLPKSSLIGPELPNGRFAARSSAERSDKDLDLGLYHLGSGLDH